MSDEHVINWQFLDDEGSFLLPQPDQTSYLYFPLVNEAGMMSAISPALHGDIKVDQNHFLTLPVSVEDLHSSRQGREFWIKIDGFEPWSLSGTGADQVRKRGSTAADQVELEAGFLWHKVRRFNRDLAIGAEVTSFVPPGDDRVEIMRVTLTNAANRPLTITPTAAIPLYGRSADNLRDHRHVTSLLHRLHCHAYGVVLRPTMSFDERGHQLNDTTYAVLGMEGDGTSPIGFFPVIEDYIGEGGSLDWPGAVVQDLAPTHQVGDEVSGYEGLAGLRFQTIELAAGATQTYLLILGVFDTPVSDTLDHWLADYGRDDRCRAWLDRTAAYWTGKLNTLCFRGADRRFDRWLRWVALQPTLRRLYGNSFLPYHDYGRGGRGWRDLWQDILALLIMEDQDVGETLRGHFAGVRLDGSNATIIGVEPGEFKADRNNIPRVWMDHGAWPLLTVRLYLDQSGDLDFLLRDQVYFKDHLSHRGRHLNAIASPEGHTVQKTVAGSIYHGSVLEHLLVQHLTALYHVGEHNIILLEGADWNDGLDMAGTRGESVAFTALYAWNLTQLAEMIEALAGQGVEEIKLADELLVLLQEIDLDSVQAKQARLKTYFTMVEGDISGRQTAVPGVELAARLRAMASWATDHLRSQEWLDEGDGCGWFNGYYDDHGRRVEGITAGDVRMTLTGQVFPLMGGIADEGQVDAILCAAERYLYDPNVGGYRLNTDFGEIKLHLGRAFAFAYGHKENGAMFSHMAVMYAYALYRRGRAREGWQILKGIYQQCQDFAISRMYPGIPEYFSDRGRGMYPWLTGSASWMILTLVQQTYGIRGAWGDLILAPQLQAEQFDTKDGAVIETLFAGRRLLVCYHNPERLDPSIYGVSSVQLNGQELAFTPVTGGALLRRHQIAALDARRSHRLDILLTRTRD